MNRQREEELIMFCDFLIDMADKLEICHEPFYNLKNDVETLIEERDFYKAACDSANEIAHELHTEEKETPKTKGFWLL